MGVDRWISRFNEVFIKLYREGSLLILGIALWVVETIFPAWGKWSTYPQLIPVLYTHCPHFIHSYSLET